MRTPALPACWKLESQDATQEESTELRCARSGRHSELMGHPCVAEMLGQALPRLGSTMRDKGGFGFLLEAVLLWSPCCP